MRYYKKDGKEFLENGKNVVRVTEMDRRPSPTSIGRVVKFLAVNEVIVTTESSSKQISHGSVLALSFPPEHVNSNDYVWYQDGREEECQVPVKLKLLHARQ